ncbi:MAG: ABC transporter substrate-binding protein [Defluviitaleaceae bacterium]|nr:ABC transporter substrate-binding protein [Defluviitaleaceae bacterium]
MSKRLIVLLAVLIVPVLLAACTTTPPAPAPAPPAAGDTGADTPAPAGGVTEITLINNKVEIDAPLRAFAALYEQQFGVRVNIQSFGGETPYAPALTALLNAGDEPEIFVFEGLADFQAARDGGRLTDLSAEPWVADTDVAYYDEQGRIVGFPVAIEGWGLGYNRDLLARAGVDPASMVNIAGIRAAFEQVDSMRDELGITAVVSMAAGPGMTWVTGLHAVNAYLSLGLDYDDTSIIDMMLDGQVDETRLHYFAEYMALLFQYSNPTTLLVGGYDQQLGDFATGNTVFIHQGNWVDPTFAELGIHFDMGYVPHAFLPETTNGIFVGAPSWYLVNARSAGIQEAKDFLAFMAASPEGHNYMVMEAGMVPAFRSVTLEPPGPLSGAVQEWANAGRMYAWHQNEMPAGFGMNTLGPIFSELASGSASVDDFMRLFSEAVANIGPS